MPLDVRDGAARSARDAARALVEQVSTSIERTCGWLIEQQHADGHWCAELEGDTILESEYLLLMAWLGREHTAPARAAARYLELQQNLDGGWSQFPGGPLDISVSVKAYFALKLVGTSPDAPHMQRAREAILAAGGADRVNSFTRFYLALLGQISYEQCPAAPPELVLLPDWSPINLYRMSAWSRTIVVPLTIIWALRPVRMIESERGISELFCAPPEQWPPLRSPGLDGPPSGWERFFRGVDRMLKLAERRRFRPLRSRALRAAQRWMLERFEDSDGLGAIFPPIVWSIIALRALGYPLDHPAVVECFQQLDGLMIFDRHNGEETLRLQPCKSPVWDTAIAQRALVAASGATTLDADTIQSALGRSTRWLLDREVRRPGDWARRASVAPSGWYFEYRNVFYPDVDDTIMVIMALRELADSRPLAPERGEISAACERAVRWVLALQNRDGGWGAFDRDNDAEFLCHVPFADHNAMIDPSTPDITARALEALAHVGIGREHPAVQRALTLLRATQEPDGSWYGRWGVNYIYGTWQVLVGLAAIGVDPNDPMVQRGAEWLLEHQQATGGWGESVLSYSEPAWHGRGTPTASQTAWALLGLMAADCSDRQAVTRGIQYLVDTQLADGRWDEPEFTGTGFPRVFYLRYHMYPIYFPLLALSRYMTWSGASLERRPLRVRGGPPCDVASHP